MVLRLPDAPTGFELTAHRYVSNAQAAAEDKGVKKDYKALGRLTGYEVTFQRSGVTGLLEVSSSASTYKTAAGAHRSLAASAQSVEGRTSPKFHRLSVGAPLGHEARFYKATLSQGGTKIDIYTVVWRSGHVYSAVIGGALAGTMDGRVVVALAQKQQKRIDAAS